MPKGTVSDVVFARGVRHIAPQINAICEKHRTPPADLVRGLLEAAAAFYDEHGFFSFPVRIEPEAFQRSWLAHAAEQPQGSYVTGVPVKIDHLAMAAAAERAADEELRRRARPKKPKHSPR